MTHISVPDHECIDADPFAARAQPRRILALVETGRAGANVIALASELARGEDCSVTVVGLAPQAPRLKGCGPSAASYNAAVRDQVAAELAEAIRLLTDAAGEVESRSLVEGADPPLEELVIAGRFDLVLVPLRRQLLRRGGHPALAGLRRTSAEVRLVDRRA